MDYIHPQTKVGSLAGVLTSVEGSMTRQGVLTVLGFAKIISELFGYVPEPKVYALQRVLVAH